MDAKLIEANDHVVKARDALRRGDKDTARDLGEKAVLLVPDLEDAWLILVAADPNPEDALAYAQKALELNPASPRARKAVEWATAQLKHARLAPDRNVPPETSPPPDEPVRRLRSEAPAVALAIPVYGKSPAQAEEKSNNRTLLYAGIVLGLLVCAVLGVVAWLAFKGLFASVLSSNQVIPTQGVLWAQVNVPKPGVTPIDVSAFAPQPTSMAAVTTDIPTLPSGIPTRVLAKTPTAIPTEAPTSTPGPTETPGVMAMDVIADTPTSVYVPPTAAPPPAAVVASLGHGGTRWIDVNLSTQSVYAYEGDTVVNSFIVSTGTWLTPTVTGKYKIYIKLKSGNMSGPGYFLPNVPYIMYFYKSYGLHGTYWHNNFGTPMSHGCINLRTSDAEWLFNWASLGTVVNVHY